MNQKLSPEQILYEDNHLIVVSKPAGIATMGAVESEPSLVKLVKEYIKVKYQKPGNVFLGVVSRIDAFVSGVIVFAKTSKAASRISEQFRAGSVGKQYLAVLEGTVRQQSGKLTSWVKKNDRLRRMESFTSELPGTQRAELEYQVIATSKKFSLVQVELLTGRKHQIRCQFSDLGHPIFGDRKYDSQFQMGHAIALHCTNLKLEHPTLKEPLHFSAELPESWRMNAHLSALLSKYQSS